MSEEQTDTVEKQSPGAEQSEAQSAQAESNDTAVEQAERTGGDAGTADAGGSTAAADAASGAEPAQDAAVRKLDEEDFGADAATAEPTVELEKIDLLRDVELNVKIELGRTQMLVEDVLRLKEGAIVQLDRLAGDPVDVFVNEQLVARGEVLVLNDNFCVRISEVVGREDG